MTALAAEVAASIAAFRRGRDAQARPVVVRNGKVRPRMVTLGAGARAAIAAPRVDDRLSGLSEIGGEMVPHPKFEEAIGQLPRVPVCAVTSLPDAPKGERLVAFYNGEEKVTPGTDREAPSHTGLPKLWLPEQQNVDRLDALSMLATGKVDLKNVKPMAAERATDQPS